MRKNRIVQSFIGAITLASVILVSCVNQAESATADTMDSIQVDSIQKPDIIVYNAYQYSQNVYDYGRECWTGWSEWEKSNTLIQIDYDNGIITIFTSKKKVYNMENVGEGHYDEDGGYVVEIDVVDQDDDKGTICLRADNAGYPQLYVKYADVMCVYNVKKTN